MRIYNLLLKRYGVDTIFQKRRTLKCIDPLLLDRTAKTRMPDVSAIAGKTEEENFLRIASDSRFCSQEKNNPAFLFFLSANRNIVGISTNL